MRTAGLPGYDARGPRDERRDAIENAVEKRGYAPTARRLKDLADRLKRKGMPQQAKAVRGDLLYLQGERAGEYAAKNAPKFAEAAAALGTRE